MVPRYLVDGAIGAAVTPCIAKEKMSASQRQSRFIARTRGRCNRTHSGDFTPQRLATHTEARETMEMWRALFMALGLSAVLVGVECLVVEKAVLAKSPAPAADGQGSVGGGTRDFIPPDWAPWSLMSTGAVTMLYSVTLPKRGG